MTGKIIRKFQDNTWITPVLTVLGFLLYSIQAWAYALIQTSFVDEGGYLYIGALYARGILRPFQDYGPARWYPPLAYLIPGQIEKWFGESLLTGRFFSVLCGIGMLIPVWLVARRMGGKWWGVAILWSFVLTPVAIQIYSLALSQALVACFLAWSLFFVLAEKRKLWQIVTGSILAGLTIMTRQNLFPLIPLLVAYVFWQHGKKAGWWSLAGSLIPLAAIHASYWPNILQLWAVWLPARWTPFLKVFRFPAAQLVSSNSLSFSASSLALLQGFRFHYFSLVGFFVCALLWPRRDGWRNRTDQRAAYFLGSLFLVLALLHAWATVSTSEQAATCTFCFTPYLSFFDLVALLLVVVTFPSWRRKLSKIAQAGIVLFIVLLAAGLGYAGFDRFGPWLMGIPFPAITRGMNPRRWVPFITLWDILSNKFHLDYWTSRVNVSIIVATILGILLVGLVATGYSTLVKRNHLSGYPFGGLLLVVCLFLGIWLSPLMSGSYRQDGICLANIPGNYQKIGQELSGVIPPGSRVYWDVMTAVPLLYAPGISIYPSQVYALYSYRVGGDPEQLAKYGLWNAALASQWMANAGFIVTEADWNQTYRPAGGLSASQFDEFQTAPTNPCDPGTSLTVYKRKP
jgi:Dolichyl-phosphate-mannose-protein mannosyltransferase